MNSQEILLLKHDVEILNHFLKEIEQISASWITFKDTPEQKIYYKNEKNIKTLSLYLE